MMSISRTNARRRPAPAVGTLLLRPPTGPVATRLIWPPAARRRPSEVPGPQAALPPLLLLRPGPPDALRGADLGSRLSTRAGAVVLDAPIEGAARPAVAEFALGWLADHAAEIGADPRRLAVIGLGSAAHSAASVACRAAADGWPALTQQVIVFPDPPTLAVPAGAGPLAGVCGCSLITDRSAPDDQSCERLRAAGVPIRRLPVDVDAGAGASTRPVEPVLDAIAAALQDAWRRLFPPPARRPANGAR